MTQTPEITDSLLNWLVEIYPNRLPDKEISAFDLGVKIGIQKVITHLQVEKQRQDEECGT